MKMTGEQKMRTSRLISTLVDSRLTHQGMRDKLTEYGCTISYPQYYGMRQGTRTPTKCLIDALCRFRGVNRESIFKQSVYDALPRCCDFYCTHGQDLD